MFKPHLRLSTCVRGVEVQCPRQFDRCCSGESSEADPKSLDPEGKINDSGHISSDGSSTVEQRHVSIL